MNKSLTNWDNNESMNLNGRGVPDMDLGNMDASWPLISCVMDDAVHEAKYGVEVQELSINY